MTYPDLWILRHGETEWNAAGRMQGHLDSPLTERGREQAVRQGALLEGLDFGALDVWMSPLGRAVQTAAIALDGRARILRSDDRLMEIGMGEWQGRARAELDVSQEQDGLLYYDSAPGGEGFPALYTRCRSFLDDLERPAVLVTHGITSRMLRLIATGQGMDGLSDLPGGQGVVHVVRAGRHDTLGGEP
ncbi:histidine phosphatase family protein [Aestuariibius sp. 2305UL40-4]|uniref:histidine phosphatase family protein n=1 Tax=Aestuariibius violaceus TaxID=3234132 RepID=UPI00345EBC63